MNTAVAALCGMLIGATAAIIAMGILVAGKMTDERAAAFRAGERAERHRLQRGEEEVFIEELGIGADTRPDVHLQKGA